MDYTFYHVSFVTCTIQGLRYLGHFSVTLDVSGMTRLVVRLVVLDWCIAMSTCSSSRCYENWTRGYARAGKRNNRQRVYCCYHCFSSSMGSMPLMYLNSWRLGGKPQSWLWLQSTCQSSSPQVIYGRLLHSSLISQSHLHWCVITPLVLQIIYLGMWYISYKEAMKCRLGGRTCEFGNEGRFEFLRRRDLRAHSNRRVKRGEIRCFTLEQSEAYLYMSTTVPYDVGNARVR